MPIASKQRMREELRYMFNHPEEGFVYYDTLAEASQVAQEALTAEDSSIIIYEVRRVVERKPITYAQLDFAWPKERA